MTHGGRRDRIESLKDEMWVEALVGANHECAEVRDQTFAEIARIALEAKQLLHWKVAA